MIMIMRYEHGGKLGWEHMYGIKWSLALARMFINHYDICQYFQGLYRLN